MRTYEFTVLNENGPGCQSMSVCIAFGLIIGLKRVLFVECELRYLLVNYVT